MDIEHAILLILLTIAATVVALLLWRRRGCARALPECAGARLFDWTARGPGSRRARLQVYENGLIAPGERGAARWIPRRDVQRLSQVRLMGQPMTLIEISGHEEESLLLTLDDTQRRQLDAWRRLAQLDRSWLRHHSRPAVATT